MHEILDQIERQKAHFGEHMQPGCPEEGLQHLAFRAKKELGAEVPQGYLGFLRRTNGLDWNGSLFFAARPTPYYDNPQMTLEGLIEANERLHEVPANRDFLVFGESGMEMYVLDLRNGEFNVVDHVSTDTYESFDSFEDLLTAALEKRLLKGI
jgi:hypothetical protein